MSEKFDPALKAAWVGSDWGPSGFDPELEMNDKSDATFDDIADYIEKHLK